VIISITRYRDIDRGFVKRTILWRPYIIRYRARTHVSRVCCSHTEAESSASDWCRRSLCTPSVASSAWHSLRLTCHAAHWEPGVGTGGRQLHQWWAKLCVQKGPLCSSYRVVSKS